MELQSNAGLAKSVNDLAQRSAAVSRINNSIHLHGKNMTDTLKKLTDTGSPILNAPIRSLVEGKLAGSPDLQRFNIALQEFRREYGLLQAGGAQSKAMMPVSYAETADKLMDNSMTVGQAIASYDQVIIEAENAEKAMRETQKGIMREVQDSVIGRALSGQSQSPSESKSDNKQGMTLPDSVAIKYLEKFKDADKAREAARKDGWSVK